MHLLRYHAPTTDMSWTCNLLHKLHVHTLGLVRDGIPRELPMAPLPPGEPHPLAVLKVLEQPPHPPRDAPRVRVDMQTVDLVPHKLPRSAACGDYDRFASGPCLEDHDAKGLVAGGDADHVARAEKVLETVTAHAAQKPDSMADAKLVCPPLQLPSHVSVPHEHAHGVGPLLYDLLHGLNHDVGALLHHEPGHKQNGWLHSVDAIPPLDFPRVDKPLVLPDVDAVIRHANLVLLAELALDLVAEAAADANDAVRVLTPLTFDVSDALRVALKVVVAAPAILGRVHRQHAPPSRLLHLDEGLGGEPVVAVHDVELGVHEGLGLLDEPHKLVAHAVNLSHEVLVEVDRHTVHVDSMDLLVVVAVDAGARKQMHLVPPSAQPRRNLGDMGRHTADRDGMQRFPRAERDTKLPSTFRRIVSVVVSVAASQAQGGTWSGVP
mmetsp:Transcript_40429/g.79213  ORF Transcript_40429/g.79213 Transcript_40429/m.79213 type:complete len:436 (+) Transcript_40429:202-1509(+)